MPPGDCIFCKIVNKEIPGLIIEENDEVIVFVSLENHPLIVPKRHVEDIFSLDEAAGSAVMAESVRIARAMKNALSCDGVYVTQANGEAAGQDVFHYHMHLYPRWSDGRSVARDNGAREELMRQIQSCLAK